MATITVLLCCRGGSCDLAARPARWPSDVLNATARTTPTVCAPPTSLYLSGSANSLSLLHARRCPFLALDVALANVALPHRPAELVLVADDPPILALTPTVLQPARLARLGLPLSPGSSGRRRGRLARPRGLGRCLRRRCPTRQNQPRVQVSPAETDLAWCSSQTRADGGLSHADKLVTLPANLRQYQTPQFISDLLHLLRRLRIPCWSSPDMHVANVKIFKVSGSLTNAVFFVSYQPAAIDPSADPHQPLRRASSSLSGSTPSVSSFDPADAATLVSLSILLDVGSYKASPDPADLQHSVS